ncbi:hypothetical protein Tco_0387305 [Tanacetum coccineum]
MLMCEQEKILSDFKDVQANLLRRIKILENDFKRSQAQSINFELKLQHRKEKMACDVSLTSKMTKLRDENVLLKTQVEFVVHERENIKLEYQKPFNTIKATRVQHQREISELIENVNKKTYAYGDVRKLLCVTPLNKNKEVKAKKVSKTKVKTDSSKPVTSYYTPKNEQCQTQSANVIARGMYKITKIETQMPVTKTNISSSNSTSVASSNSVRRPESKDTNSKKRVLLNTKSKKSTSTKCPRKFT